MQQMKAIRDQYDPRGGRASGSREMLDSKEAEYGGEMLYINKSLTRPLWAMEFRATRACASMWMTSRLHFTRQPGLQPEPGFPRHRRRAALV